MNLKSKVAGETGEMEDPVTGEVQILLTSKEDSVSMRSLGVSWFNFKVSCIVFVSGVLVGFLNLGFSD